MRTHAVAMWCEYIFFGGSAKEQERALVAQSGRGYTASDARYGQFLRNRFEFEKPEAF